MFYVIGVNSLIGAKNKRAYQHPGAGAGEINDAAGSVAGAIKGRIL